MKMLVRRDVVRSCALVLSSLFAGTLLACPYSIRDSAFIGGHAAPPFRLKVLIDGPALAGSPSESELAGWLRAAATNWLADANVEASVLDVADAAARAQLPEGIALPADLPTAMLVSPDGARSLFVPGISRKNLSLNAVMETARGLIESPLRRRLQGLLVESWCVALLVEGTDGAENARAQQAVEAASKSITGQSTEMGRVVTRGPALLTVSHRDPREHVTLWSLGLESPGAAIVPVRALMLVGRGERRGPLLEGDEVTAEKLLEMFTMLGRSCSCTTAENWLSGPSLPLAWSAATEAAARTELGFDPSDPAALSSIRGVRGGAAVERPVTDPLLGYTETSLGAALEELTARDGEPPAAAGSSISNDASPLPDGAATRVAASSDEVVSAPARPVPAPPPARTGRRVLTLLVGLALVSLAAATVVVVRRKA